MSRPASRNRINHARLIVLLLLGLASSQPHAQYEVVRSTLNNGGGEAASAGYQVQGSIGQVDVAPTTGTAGGGYTSVAGFWSSEQPAEQNTELIFKDDFELR